MNIIFLDEGLYWLRPALEGAGFRLNSEVSKDDQTTIRLIAYASIERFREDLMFFSRYLVLQPRGKKRAVVPEGTLLLRGTPKNPHVPGASSWVSNLILLLKVLFRETECEGRLNSYITDSFANIIDSQLLSVQKEEIEKLNEELSSISRTDFLTGLFNRRAFFETLQVEKKRAVRFFEKRGKGDRPVGEMVSPEKFACLMLDIDHFKIINDQYGHLVGDEVLRKLGDILLKKDIFREKDLIGRYGGEEFVIVLPDTDEKIALTPAERLREVVKHQIFDAPNGEKFNVTLSLGITDFLPGEKDEIVIGRADKALYNAKKRGRNCSCLFSDIPKD